MHLYTVRLQHDKGHVTLTLPDVDPNRAVRRLLVIERAPLCAVVWVKRRPICDY
jgi:hypothetical protein